MASLDGSAGGTSERRALPEPIYGMAATQIIISAATLVRSRMGRQIIARYVNLELLPGWEGWDFALKRKEITVFWAISGSGCCVLGNLSRARSDARLGLWIGFLDRVFGFRSLVSVLGFLAFEAKSCRTGLRLN